MENLKIVSCKITDPPKSLFDPIPQVWVILENGQEMYLFDFYPDEISFKPHEFIGLTMSEGKRLKFIKDRHFLTT